MPDKTHHGPSIPVQVNARIEPGPGGEKPQQSVAYAFNANGRLLSKVVLDDKGDASLHVPALARRQEVRIIIGPEIPDEKATVSELTRRGAVDKSIIIGAEAPSRVAFEIAHIIWPCWFGTCRVSGTLLKRVLSGGVPVDLPVCCAQVEIYEVEPWEIILTRVPDLVIENIRQAVLNPPPPPEAVNLFLFPVNPPDPAPFLASRSLASRATVQSAATAVPAHAASNIADLQFLAKTASTAQFRQAAIEYAPILRFILCELIPIFVTTRLIAVVDTDRCGHFETYIFRSCFFPSVNLYFRATSCFFDIPIYSPVPVACYTYWNYQCGTEVTLHTDSPFAITCQPCPPVDGPENFVLFQSIGALLLNSIYGTGLNFVATPANLGQIPAGVLSGILQDAPFGGTMRPFVQFDNSLRDNNLAKYYQISYRLGTSGDFQPLVGDVNRHYIHQVGTEFVITPYNLGPQPVNNVPNMFEIPPALPPAGQWNPIPIDDTTSALFPSASLPPVPPPPAAPDGTHGKYQLKLDLFDANAQPVDIAAAGIEYIVPTTVDPDGTIHTTNAAGLGLVVGNSFIMTLHVDNRYTQGSLGTPTLDGNLADDCGVLRYSSTASNVTTPYTATHPDNFAQYSYRLSRGATPLTPPTASGNVSAATDPATPTESVATLLGSCDLAGFAEDLSVAATAYDGWSRQSQYDSNPGPVAFVLAPPKA
jgi:hypothetical protein